MSSSSSFYIHHVLTLPEVLLIMAAALSRRDQARCARVCRQWHAVFSPFLWRSVSLTPPSKLSANDLETIDKNMAQIASFDWRSRSLVHRPPDASSSSSPPPSFPTMASLQRLGFFQHAVRLESLILHGDFEVLPILQMLIQAHHTVQPRHEAPLGLARLKRLTLRSTSTAQEIVSIDQLLQAWHRLEECTIETRAILDEGDLQEEQSTPAPAPSSSSSSSSGSMIKSTFPSQPKRLRSLDINIRSLSRKGLAKVLSHCSFLEHLKVIDYGTTYISEGFGDLLQQTCPALKSLVLVAHGHQVQGQELVQALMRFPRLAHLGIESMRWGDQSFVALQDHCPCIESLDIGMSSGWKIRSHTLQRFLVASKGLKHLKVRGLRLAVEDMVDPETGSSIVEWGCTGLETLSIGFGHAGPYSVSSSATGSGGNNGGNGNGNSRGRGGGGGEHGPRLTASQIIHRQLARLGQLKTLELLVPIVPIRPRSMSIRGSGQNTQQSEKDLEWLSSLQQLKHLRILGTGQGSMLTERQIQWMVQAWPRLESIVVPTSDHLRRAQFELWAKQQKTDSQQQQQQPLHASLGRSPALIVCQCCE